MKYIFLFWIKKWYYINVNKKGIYLEVNVRLNINSNDLEKIEISQNSRGIKEQGWDFESRNLDSYIPTYICFAFCYYSVSKKEKI